MRLRRCSATPKAHNEVRGARRSHCDRLGPVGAVGAVGRGRFVGRQAEFSELTAAVEEAIDGQGRGFLIVGDAGMGKTRLATELGDHARGAGLRVLWGRCWEAGGAPPYWPWTEVLRTAEAAGAPPFDIPEGADRFQLFGAVADHLRRTGDACATLIILDDLHAADLASLLLLEHVLGGALWQSRVAIVALARESELSRNDAGQRLRRLARTIRLVGLTRDEVASLIEQRVDVLPSAETVDAVHEATEGNPLFVEEMAALLGRGPARVPAGIRDVIRQRLAPLPAETVRLLAAGAVMGREFDLDLSVRLVSSDGGAAGGIGRGAIDEAVRADLVAPTAGGRYRFGHMLVRDVLYDDLPATTRARYHGEIGRSLEQRDELDPVDHFDELAHHFVAAGDAERERAVRYLLLAAEHAERRLAHERAVAHYEHALDLAEHDDVDRRCAILLSLGRAADRAGFADQSGVAFRRAAEIARDRGDAVRFGLATLGATGRVAFQQHDRGTIAALDEALAVVPADEQGLRARLLAALARNLGYAGMGEPMVQTAERAVIAARASGDPEVLGDALTAWLLTLWTPDRLSERLRTATELLELSERNGDLERALEAHMCRMICQLELGDGREFDRSLAAYGRLADELRQPRYRFMALVRRAMRELMRGSYAEGRRLAEEARRLGNQCQEPDAEPVYFGMLALPSRDDGVGLEEVERFFVDFSTRHTSAGSRALLASLALARGDTAAARRDVEAVAATIDELPKDLDWLLCLALSGEVVHALDDVELARKLYPLLAPYEDRCVMIAGAVGFAGSVAHYLGLLATTIHSDAAERHFSVAREHYRALGAEPWLARVERHHAVVDTASVVHRSAAIHRRDADWLVRYGETELRLPDAKGLHHLAVLLSHPGREVHVLDLTGAGGMHEGDGGPLLDATAKDAYRRRVRELRDDLEEAEAWADTERAERARVELDAITAELSAALGLGGRDRRAATNVDRARVSVRKAIVRTLREISRVDPALGRYLETTVRTGTYCVFEPDPRFPTTWEVTA